MSEDWIESVEKRVQVLEDRVFGDANKDAHYPACIESLGNLNAKMMTVAASKEKHNKILRRLSELEQYLDPEYAGRLTLTDDSKINILLAQEELIMKIAQDLEHLDKIKDILDSEHMKVLPAMVKKFEELSQKHIEQQDSVASLSDETKQLLQKYHTLITLLSKQFVMWDETLTNAEIKANPKKNLD